MNYNRESIEKFIKLSDAVDNQEFVASEHIRVAKDRFEHRTHKIKRDGAVVELTEKVLWNEVFMMGLTCSAGKKLKELHPQVFEAYAKQDMLAAELKEMGIKEFGVDYTQMKMASFLRLIDGVIGVKLKEAGVAK